MTTPFVVRPAAVADAPSIARHRAEMLRDIGTLPDALYPRLVDASLRYLEHAIPSGEYVGWLATAASPSEAIVAGVGVQLHTVLPHLAAGGRTIASGPEGLMVNVFTERSWRRSGVARELMQHLLEWGRANCVERLALHASAEGRPL